MHVGIYCNFESNLHKHMISPVLFGGVCVAHLFSSWCCPIMCLRSEFRVVISVTISAWKPCLVRLYLHLFVGGRMSYLRYLCLFAHSGVQHILCCVFVLFSLVLFSLVYVASFSGFSLFDPPSVFSKVYVLDWL